MDEINHADQHSDINDIAEALEAKVGIIDSAVETSHDFRIRALEDDTHVQLHGTQHEVGGDDLVDHDALTNFVANEHIDHTSVTLTAGVGLSGGGDISANRSFALSHLGLEDLTDPGADRILFWDDSETKTDWLTVGTGLAITDTTITTDDANIDHGSLGGLSDDDHAQYILHSLADAANDFLVASGNDTFVKKTLAETGAILEGDIDHGNIQGLGDGSDHSFIDQDVTSGSSPTFTGTNITGIPAESILAGTFGTGAYVFDNTVSGITTLTAQDMNLTDTSPVITMTNTTQGDAQGDRASKISFVGTNTLAQEECLAEIEGNHGSADADPDGNLFIRTALGGACVLRAWFNQEGLAIGDTWTASADTALYIARDDAYISLHNTTHENGVGARETLITFKGENSSGSVHSVALIKASSNTATTGLQGKLEFFTNDGNDVNIGQLALEIDEMQDFDFQDGNLLTTGTLDAGAGTLTSLDVSEGNITNVGVISLDSITGDNNAIAIGDGGDTIVLNPITNVDFSDKNIINVGEIDLDLIRSDAANGTIVIELDNSAGADLKIGNNNALVVTGDDDRIGIGELNPVTLIEVTNTAPYVTFHNSTHENTSLGRESRFLFRGEKSDGSEHVLARFDFNHDGGGDDQKGRWQLFLNDGDDGFGPTERITVKADGNMGLTNGNPLARLDVIGDARIGDSTTNYAQIDADGDLSFVGTSRIDWTKITANGITVTGCTTGDTVSDLQTPNDGNTVTCSEVAATTNHLVVDFTGVTAFNWVKILAYYDGGNTHNLDVQVEIAPFDGTAWDSFDCMDHSPATTHCSENHSFFVPDDSAYINSGVVKIRILHIAGTVNAHLWVFDEISLYQ